MDDPDEVRLSQFSIVDVGDGLVVVNRDYWYGRKVRTVKSDTRSSGSDLAIAQVSVAAAARQILTLFWLSASIYCHRAYVRARLAIYDRSADVCFMSCQIWGPSHRYSTSTNARALLGRMISITDLIVEGSFR